MLLKTNFCKSPFLPESPSKAKGKQLNCYQGAYQCPSAVPLRKQFQYTIEKGSLKKLNEEFSIIESLC